MDAELLEGMIKCHEFMVFNCESQNKIGFISLVQLNQDATKNDVYSIFGSIALYEGNTKPYDSPTISLAPSQLPSFTAGSVCDGEPCSIHGECNSGSCGLLCVGPRVKTRRFRTKNNPHGAVLDFDSGDGIAEKTVVTAIEVSAVSSEISSLKIKLSSGSVFLTNTNQHSTNTALLPPQVDGGYFRYRHGESFLKCLYRSDQWIVYSDYAHVEDHSEEMKWKLMRDGLFQLVGTSLCMTLVTDEVIQLRSCYDTGTSKWVHGEDGRFTLNDDNSGMCLGVFDPNDPNSKYVRMVDCDESLGTVWTKEEYVSYLDESNEIKIALMYTMYCHHLPTH